jgi:hypothetical protein
MLSTIAGRDTEQGAEDGPIDTARLYWPNGITVDDAGTRLFFNDGYGAVVRQIDLSAGQISTIAGVFNDFGAVDGPLGTSRLNEAVAVRWLNGVLYVGDGSALRAWDPGTGNLTTRAGMLLIAGLTDGTGANARRVDIATMAVTTIAGGWVPPKRDRTRGVAARAEFAVRYRHPRRRRRHLQRRERAGAHSRPFRALSCD